MFPSFLVQISSIAKRNKSKFSFWILEGLSCSFWNQDPTKHAQRGLVAQSFLLYKWQCPSPVDIFCMIPKLVMTAVKHDNEKSTNIWWKNVNVSFFFSPLHLGSFIRKKNSHRHHHSESSILIMLKMAINIYSYQKKHPTVLALVKLLLENKSSHPIFSWKVAVVSPTTTIEEHKIATSRGNTNLDQISRSPKCVKNCEKGLLL